MVNATYPLLWYILIMFVTTTQSFPDGSIGKKYVLARTSNGYELVPDGSKLPGIQVSAVNVPTVKPEPRPNVAISSPITTKPPSTLNHLPLSGKIDLLKDKSGPQDKEGVVTLALQGRDGLNGRPGPKGKQGPPGPSGRQGPQGLKGKPGTCELTEFQCDQNTIRSLTTRISQLEKSCAKLLNDKTGGSTSRPTNT